MLVSVKQGEIDVHVEPDYGPRRTFPTTIEVTTTSNAYHPTKVVYKIDHAASNYRDHEAVTWALDKNITHIGWIDE
jgi:hypothetical protein